MIRVRKAEERGHFDHGWLNTYEAVEVRATSPSEVLLFDLL
jgi:hypothetical protein